MDYSSEIACEVVFSREEHLISILGDICDGTNSKS